MIRFSRSLRGIARAVGVLSLAFSASFAAAQDADLSKKVDQLSKQVEELRGQLSSTEAKGTDEVRKPNWVSFGGDLRVRHDILRAHAPSYTDFSGNPKGASTIKNGSLLTNRLGLNVNVKPAESVSMHVRVLAYKIFGMQEGGATQTGLFGDRDSKTFDGTSGHVPADGIMRIDYAYATIKDLFGTSAWFSAGRRPSTGGAPTNVRDDREVAGAAGIPGLLVDYAFDGATLGVAPEIDALPGFAAKLCYGRAFESGYRQGSDAQGSAAMRDADMLGVSMLAYETPDARVDVQYQRGFNIMDGIPGPTVATNLGDIENFGGSVLRTVRELGPGDLTVFGSGAVSAAHPNGNRYSNNSTMPGLMCDGPDCANKTGMGLYTGLRYDVTKTRTKLGAEYNYGSKDWITFVPAGDDIWTSKLGTRGNVYELYAIQDIGRAPIARDGRVFFRLGWQYYDFKYTGSNSWIGNSKSISGLRANQAQMSVPIRNAYDVYTTFEVRF